MDPRDRPAAKQPPSLTPEQLDARALARGRRAAMRRRVHRIRRGIAGLAAALFSAAFLAVYVQLASGHDPALSAKKGATASQSSSSAGSSGESSTSGSSGTSSGTESSTSSSTPATSSETSTSSSTAGKESSIESSSSGSKESSGGTSAVTTSQS
jgi:cytoskeletal protein RodZ